MPDFNQENPPKAVTNPTGSTSRDYPRHLHKWAGTHEDGSPKLNAYVVVHSDAEKAAKEADGWSLEPVMVAPKGKKAEAKD